MNAPVFDTTFQSLLGKALLYAALVFILSAFLVHYSVMITSPATCPTFTGVTYYRIPIG
jgi:hypothetical protein